MRKMSAYDSWLLTGDVRAARVAHDLALGAEVPPRVETRTEGADPAERAPGGVAAGVERGRAYEDGRHDGKPEEDDEHPQRPHPRGDEALHGAGI
jgi:hypothetical protein